MHPSSLSLHLPADKDRFAIHHDSRPDSRRIRIFLLITHFFFKGFRKRFEDFVCQIGIYQWIEAMNITYGNGRSTLGLGIWID